MGVNGCMHAPGRCLILGAAHAGESWTQSGGESHHFVPAPCPPQQSKPLWSSNSSPAGFGLSQDAWPCCCSPTGLISHPCRSAAPGVTGRSCPRVPLQPGSWLSRVLPRGDSLAHRQTHTASGSLRARSQGMAPVQRRLPWGCPARRHRARKRSTGAGEVSLLPVLPVPSPAWWLSPVGAGSQGRGAEPLILGVRICPKAVERGKLGGVAAAQGDGDWGGRLGHGAHLQPGRCMGKGSRRGRAQQCPGACTGPGVCCVEGRARRGLCPVSPSASPSPCWLLMGDLLAGRATLSTP